MLALSVLFLEDTVARTRPYAGDRRARWSQGDATATGTATLPAPRVTHGGSSASQLVLDHDDGPFGSDMPFWLLGAHVK